MRQNTAVILPRAIGDPSRETELIRHRFGSQTFDTDVDVEHVVETGGTCVIATHRNPRQAELLASRVRVTFKSSDFQKRDFGGFL